MAQITSYICDVSGKSGTDKKDFVQVQIIATDPQQSYSYGKKTIDKLIHRDVALKLHLIYLSKAEEETIPEPTLESKFMTLLKDYVSELAYEAGAEAAYNVQNQG